MAGFKEYEFKDYWRNRLMFHLETGNAKIQKIHIVADTLTFIVTAVEKPQDASESTRDKKATQESQKKKKTQEKQKKDSKVPARFADDPDPIEMLIDQIKEGEYDRETVRTLLKQQTGKTRLRSMTKSETKKLIETLEADDHDGENLLV